MAPKTLLKKKFYNPSRVENYSIPPYTHTKQGQPFRSAVNLLQKSDLSTSFILNLYDDLEGYSIVLCDDKGA